jgi:hypothetical protein
VVEVEVALIVDVSFVGYVGDTDFHDGVVVTVKWQNGMAHVRVRGASGKSFVVDFGGVQAVRANQSEGMILYALSELSGDPPLRRFVFANWDDDSPAYLEVDAETVVVREE